MAHTMPERGCRNLAKACSLTIYRATTAGFDKPRPGRHKCAKTLSLME